MNEWHLYRADQIGRTAAWSSMNEFDTIIKASNHIAAWPVPLVGSLSLYASIVG